MRCRTSGARAHRVTVPVLTFSCLMASLEADIGLPPEGPLGWGRSHYTVAVHTTHIREKQNSLAVALHRIYVLKQHMHLSVSQ